MQEAFGREEQELRFLREQKLSEVDQAVWVPTQQAPYVPSHCVYTHTVPSWRRTEDSMLSLQYTAELEGG